VRERVGKTGGWEARGIGLNEKIEAVLDKLDPAQKQPRFEQPRLALDPKSPALYSVRTLHGYFHNRDFLPDTRDIKAAWDAWEGYLSALHDELSTAQP
jgi:hypothetical protein